MTCKCEKKCFHFAKCLKGNGNTATEDLGNYKATNLKTTQNTLATMWELLSNHQQQSSNYIAMSKNHKDYLANFNATT